jgi:hypothetical protein
MTKKEMYTLMKLIQVYYEKFQFDQYKLDSWYLILQKYSYDRIQGSLLEFVVNSTQPPKISDLIANPSCGRYIPRITDVDLTEGEN